MDYCAVPGVRQPQKSIVDGDNLSVTTAAASIVAKVTCDRIMAAYAKEVHVDEVAREVAEHDLYRRKDGEHAEGWQVRWRAAGASSGRYKEFFEVSGNNVRLIKDPPGFEEWRNRLGLNRGPAE